MSFRTGSAASWPMARVINNQTALTFRANTDAGIVFVIGQLASTTTGTLTVTLTPLPASFRPLADVTFVTTGGNPNIAMTVKPDGSVVTGGATAVGSIRGFYFATVTPA